jgi:hypothetical protein
LSRCGCSRSERCRTRVRAASLAGSIRGHSLCAGVTRPMQCAHTQTRNSSAPCSQRPRERTRRKTQKAVRQLSAKQSERHHITSLAHIVDSILRAVFTACDSGGERSQEIGSEAQLLHRL